MVEVDKEFELEFETDKGIYTVYADVTYSYYAGNWYDSDGGGCSPSSDMDYRIIAVYDENGNKVNGLPDGLTEQDIEDSINSALENM